MKMHGRDEDVRGAVGSEWAKERKDMLKEIAMLQRANKHLNHELDRERTRSVYSFSASSNAILARALPFHLSHFTPPFSILYNFPFIPLLVQGS